MKVSKTRLKQIIKEEVEKHLNKEAMDIPGLPGRTPDSAGMGDVMIDTLITGISDYMEADPSMVRQALEKYHGGLEYDGDDKEFQSRYIYPIMLKSRELMRQADGDSKRATRMVLGLE
tara:strand:- start:4110 stop:4463 length:354 start_codon:yes stop_codon:yes gene_type:complete